MTTTTRPRGRLLMLPGLGLAALGIAAYVLQLWLQRLSVPWYMPALALLGVALVAASLWERRTVWRVLALVVVVLLGGFEVMALNCHAAAAATPGRSRSGSPSRRSRRSGPTARRSPRPDLVGRSATP